MAGPLNRDYSGRDKKSIVEIDQPDKTPKLMGLWQVTLNFTGNLLGFREREIVFRGSTVIINSSSTSQAFGSFHGIASYSPAVLSDFVRKVVLSGSYNT